MNDFRFVCPHCRQRLRCDGRLAGRTVRCPGCAIAIVLMPDPAAGDSIPPDASQTRHPSDIAMPPPKPYKEP
jgi:hypothetical protein